MPKLTKRAICLVPNYRKASLLKINVRLHFCGKILSKYVKKTYFFPGPTYDYE